jgi:hypothetical protein
MATGTQLRARSLAETIQTALRVLRSAARTEDFFSNFSLAEAIEDRLVIIGTSDGGATQRTPRGRPTKLAEILFIEEALEAAIEDAKTLPAFEAGTEDVSADSEEI